MKNNKKALLILGIIALSLAIIFLAMLGSYLMYQVIKKDSKLIEKNVSDKAALEKNYITNQTSISQKQEVLKSAGITNLKSKNLYNATEKTTFDLGSNKFILYPLDDSVPKNTQEGRFEAYHGTKLIYSSDDLYNITDVFSFDSINNTYVVITAYSGGAHCCFTQFIFNIDSDGNLKLVTELATNNSTISPESFFVDNGMLYFKVLDDRFAYFYTSYAASYAFPRYFLLENTMISDANPDFIQGLVDEAQRCEADLKKINPANVYSMEDWFPTLICKTTNYWNAGDNDKAWEDFADYFTRFGSTENPDKIRSEMENILQADY